jgi:hypothetical protein
LTKVKHFIFTPMFVIFVSIPKFFLLKNGSANGKFVFKHRSLRQSTALYNSDYYNEWSINSLLRTWNSQFILFELHSNNLNIMEKINNFQIHNIKSKMLSDSLTTQWSIICGFIDTLMFLLMYSFTSVALLMFYLMVTIPVVDKRCVFFSE